MTHDYTPEQIAAARVELAVQVEPHIVGSKYVRVRVSALRAALATTAPDQILSFGKMIPGGNVAAADYNKIQCGPIVAMHIEDATGRAAPYIGGTGETPKLRQTDFQNWPDFRALQGATGGHYFPTLAEIEQWLSDGATMPPPFSLDAASAQLAELRLIYEALTREGIVWAIEKASPDRPASVRIYAATEPTSE